MKRAFDLISVVVTAPIWCPLVLILALLVRSTSPGPAIYWSSRIGRNNSVFQMPKLRTMRVDTPVVATDLLTQPDRWVTPLGRYLRKLSLDELPQLWSVLKGDMSLVGPRPALFNQMDLIKMRTELGVHCLLPGITGWAQVNGRDQLALVEKIKLDHEYQERMSILFDLRIVLITIKRLLEKGGVSH